MPESKTVMYICRIFKNFDRKIRWLYSIIVDESFDEAEEFDIFDVSVDEESSPRSFKSNITLKFVYSKKATKFFQFLLM